MASTPEMKVHLDAYLTLRAASSDDTSITLKPHALYVGGHQLGTFTDDEDEELDADIARLEAHYREKLAPSLARLRAAVDRLKAVTTPGYLSVHEPAPEPDTTYEHFKLLTIHRGWHPLAACAYLGLTKREGLVFWSGTHTDYLDEHGNVLHTEYSKA